jgi:predicted O-methyltransferase YrrM
MFPKVIAAYSANGFHVDLGNPHQLWAHLIRKDTGEGMRTGGGMSVSDALLFAALSKTFAPRNVFIIGNAFGLSTFVLADLFPAASIDVIDAEVEGADNSNGSTLTRKIADEWFPNVNLFTGFSPQDLQRAARSKSYQLVFIDGLHTNEQMYSDFIGMRPLFDSNCLVVFHDVAIFQMMDAWNKVKNIAKPDGFASYELAFTQFGLCAISRGLPETQAYLGHVGGTLSDHRFHLGIERRNSIWRKSPYDVMNFVKSKLGLIGK